MLWLKNTPKQEHQRSNVRLSEGAAENTRQQGAVKTRCDSYFEQRFGFFF